MKNIFTKSILVCLMMTSILACQKDNQPNLTSEASSKTSLLAPIVSLDIAHTTKTSIGMKITAPEGGLPAGFSLQWMTEAALVANNGVWVSETTGLCAAGFSGNANNSRYALEAGESVTVKVGELLQDNGASSNCNDALVCDTKYVFRAFAHATSSSKRSENTSNQIFSTLPCVEACTFSQGYWKNHGPALCASGNNENEWPVSGLTLGNVSYTDAELCSIFAAPVKGNGLISLAHQLIAAKFNVANGVNSINAIAQADLLIGNKNVLTGGSLSTEITDGLVNTLSTYNEGGEDGANHCK